MLNSNVHESTDEDMEESMKMVTDDVIASGDLVLPDEPVKKRRRKNTIKG